MKNSHKGFVVQLLLIIIAVLVLGGGAYLYTQAPNSPLNQNNSSWLGSGPEKIDTDVTTIVWKTYKNDIGFELKYPTNIPPVTTSSPTPFAAYLSVAVQD